MSDLIQEAVEILSRGRLVAFPTETVYGLGADATKADAVRRIFAAKGRPSTNPLICHVADASIARRYARSWPDAASRIVARFWPGPISIVLPKTDEIVSEVTAGRDTVALRAPDHPLALELLRAFDRPVAAPSANKSNHVSPTTAAHVRDELGDTIDIILDGGPCQVGIESTVLDLSSERPVILRPGGISRSQIEEVIGPVDVFGGSVDRSTAAMSPGQQEKHYAPHTPSIRFETSQRGLILADTEGHPNGIMVVSASDSVQRDGPIIAMPKLAELYARHFYGVLRELDQMGLHTIYIEVPPDRPEWAAVRDRIRRATRALSENADRGS
jgi:L-threonylcarbamoyladenylate synthase